MKHCIIMTIYKDIDFVNYLISRYPEDWGLFIHLDKKSKFPVSAFESRVTVLNNRSIFWGSINHLKAVLDLLKLAINDERNFDYFHIITGQDVNVVKPCNFDDILGNENKIYMKCAKLPVENWTAHDGGYHIYRRKTLSKYMDVRIGKWGYFFNRPFVFLQTIFNLYRPLPAYPLYGGSLYCSLPKIAVEEVFNNPLSKALLNDLELSLCGEELFFQTVLMNSTLKNNIVNDNLRYMDWNSKNPPKILDEHDYNSIMLSNCLFCRKVDKNVSKKLISLF